MLTNVSVPLSEVQARQTVAVAYRDQAAQALQDSSGVDLNTEAAEMLRLQQAYSANARVIQAARETFDTILNAAR
jgi:flagellar hook-associated protein 1 FlgK